MEQNKELELAWQFVENTGTSVFLTGKAGTGKTTFLRRLKERSPKRMIVVAPTGVAAINASGVTIHSFFQLPFSPFVPDATYASAREKYRFSRQKRNIIRGLDLLVIDEISMVRSDLLDAVDGVLRKYREPSQPFGGVQLLMIGDLQQLSPVVKDEEQALLSQYYATPYFFSSRALQQTPYVTIELQKVYRQSDETFVRLLNRIRENNIDQTVVAQLNTRFLPSFKPADSEGYIRLTTHNARAQQYNDTQLAALHTPSHTFKAEIEGTFPEYSYPTDAVLTLKVGAQVMFVKNDASADSAERRFYNGRIGHVTVIDGRTVRVRCPGDTTDIDVTPMEWENTKYTLDEATKEIREEREGIFRQYPLRLAWAITIHKSQGLTFEHAIIDANAAFAHGQVYVALSRCKTLEGLVLASPVEPSSVITDETVNAYVSNELARANDTAASLGALKQTYFVHLLNELFDFSPLGRKLNYVGRLLDEYFYKTYPQLLQKYKVALSAFHEKVETVAEKFQMLCAQKTAEELHDEALAKRIVGGADYFRKTLGEELENLFESTHVETDNKDLKKRFREAADELRAEFSVKTKVLQLTAEHGFSTSTYLKDKQTTLLGVLDGDKPSKTKGKKEKIELPSDITQPVLYGRLREWRTQKMTILGQPAYTILPQKSLICMTNFMPADANALAEMPYFGKTRTDKYGTELLDIINTYVSETGVARPEPIVGKKVKMPKIDTKKATLDLYQAGKTLEQIAEERGLSLNTIGTHLAHYVEEGVLDVASFLTPQKMTIIQKNADEMGKNISLTTLKKRCGAEVSYADIQFALAARKAGGK